MIKHGDKVIVTVDDKKYSQPGEVFLCGLFRGRHTYGVMFFDKNRQEVAEMPAVYVNVNEVKLVKKKPLGGNS